MNRSWALNATSVAPTRPVTLERGFPQEGQSATIPGIWWHYMVTEELVQAISAWGFTLDDANVGQLAQVISAIKAQLTSTSTNLATVATNTMPYGALLPWPGTTPPPGYIKANGVLLPRSGAGSYAGLTTAVTNGVVAVCNEVDWVNYPGRYSLGDGVSTIRVPDMRGLVLKGHHDGSGTRTTNTSRALGTYEADENKSHQHWIDPNQQNSSGTTDWGKIATGNQAPEGSINGFWSGLEGGPENLVRNASILWCLRAY